MHLFYLLEKDNNDFKMPLNSKWLYQAKTVAKTCSKLTKTNSLPKDIILAAYRVFFIVFNVWIMFLLFKCIFKHDAKYNFKVVEI